MRRSALGLPELVLLLAGFGASALPENWTWAQAARAPTRANVLSGSDGGEIDLSALQLRHVGPIGNRVPAVAGVPGDPLVYYAGSASGGLFKSDDGGTSWRPVFDDQPVAAIGSIAVAPSDPNVVWVGTGETFIRSNVMIGDGVYRSTDAGRTWSHVGLEHSGRIGRIAVHPEDPDVAFVAALGHAWGPQAERGLYRTRDGGASWQQVLFVDENSGAIDVLLGAGNPRVVYAATWQLEMSTSGRTSGGPGSGIFRSRDGGDTWERLGTRREQGLPKPPWGKIGLAQSAADPDRVWALIETSSNRDFAPVEGWDGEGFQGVLWRSDDGGDRWRLINRDNTLTQRPLYYTRAVAAPDDADEITFMAVQQSISHDGGATIEEQNSGWDHHDLWIDPLDGDRRIAGHDGGVSITLNRGRTWAKPQLPIAQLYHVAVDDEVPYDLYGNRQDGPSVRGPSRSLSADVIPISAWRSVGGCEVGFAVPTPGAPHRVWAGCYDGILELYDERTGQARDVSVWPLAIESWAAADLRYRFQWNFPLTLSPHDPGVAYAGSQYVHRSSDLGQTWERISPDLTSADPELMRRSGGLTLDDAGPTIAPVVFAIEESPHLAGEIWAGTNDGRLHRSRDGGSSWDDLTATLPDLPPLGTVSSVWVSRHDAARVYVTVDRHQEGDNTAYLFRSDDGGASWRSLRSDLPEGPLATARCLIEDPAQPGLLFLGTNSGLFVSLDDGDSWRSLRGRMPAAPVSWLVVQERFGDLAISTYGRGFWILDDLSPLRELARRRQETAAIGTPTLVPPRDVFRLRSRPEVMFQPDSPAAGTNPAAAAFFHLLLPAAGAADTEPRTDDAGAASLDGLELVIERRAGDGDELVRRLELPEIDAEATQAALLRVDWDLRSERTPKIALLRPPAENPELPLEGERTLSDGGRFARLVPPGRYEIVLRRAATTRDRNASGNGDEGVVLARHAFEVLQDPAAAFSPEDLAAQQELLDRIEEAIVGAARLIEASERLRQQLDEHRRWLSTAAPSSPSTGAGAAAPDDSDLAAELEEADSALAAIEDELFDLRLTPASQDTLRWQRRLYAQLVYLARRVDQSDHRPTAAQEEVWLQLQSQLAEVQHRYHEWAEGALPALRKRIADAVRSGRLLDAALEAESPEASQEARAEPEERDR